jgi:hypothetical protein
MFFLYLLWKFQIFARAGPDQTKLDLATGLELNPNYIVDPNYINRVQFRIEF